MTEHLARRRLLDASLFVETIATVAPLSCFPLALNPHLSLRTSAATRVADTAITVPLAPPSTPHGRPLSEWLQSGLPTQLLWTELTPPLTADPGG